MLQLHLSDQQFYCLLKCVLYWRLDGTFYEIGSGVCVCLGWGVGGRAICHFVQNSNIKEVVSPLTFIFSRYE